MSSVFKALSDPTRRRILMLLRERSLNAGEIAGHFSVSKPTISAHLRALRDAELVVDERRGKFIVYHLQMSILEDALMGFAGAFGMSIAPDSAQPPLPPKDNP